MSRSAQVVAVGHAIVDVLAPVPDSFVANQHLEKGTMTLVDADTAVRIFTALDTPTTASGGSAANTAAGVASFGASAAFIGKVADDELGEEFARHLREVGVSFDVPPAGSDLATGRSMIMVTGDAEKTMCTCLGAGDFVHPDDVDEELVGGADVLYLEGYLCGLEHSDEAVEKAVSVARAAGTTVSLSLSDPLWVELHGDALERLLDRTDLVFANEQEACLMTGVDDADRAADILARRCGMVAVTLGPAGTIVATADAHLRVPAEPVANVVDTTGAGDLFAAGFLYGYLRGVPPQDAARLGGLAAAEVIGHFGARPLVPLRSLIEAAGLSA